VAAAQNGLVGSGGLQLPIVSVHVRAQLIDMVAKVVIYQEYSNEEDRAIEAVYMFPVEDSASVCGFEAFINGKHLIAECKEKQQARQEYKKAIEKGHGAYLMEQETADVFKVRLNENGFTQYNIIFFDSLYLL
jgi:poly [ADP-ribose] polymerase 2/3/4